MIMILHLIHKPQCTLPGSLIGGLIIGGGAGDGSDQCSNIQYLLLQVLTYLVL